MAELADRASHTRQSSIQGRGQKISQTAPQAEYTNKTELVNHLVRQENSAEEIIAKRVQSLDLQSYPITQKQISASRMRELSQKISNRTITREEYELYDWNKRFNQRRSEGIKSFWREERLRLTRGESGTRNWTKEQRQDILNGNRAKFNNDTLHGHHAYSASKYPHLANKHEVIYPATRNEHFKGWHGGNWKNSLPGKRINMINDF